MKVENAFEKILFHFIPNRDVVKTILKDSMFLSMMTDSLQYSGTNTVVDTKLIVKPHSILKCTEGLEVRSEFDIIAIDFKKQILHTMWSNVFISDCFRFFDFHISEDFMILRSCSKELPYLNSTFIKDK